MKGVYGFSLPIEKLYARRRYFLFVLNVLTLKKSKLWFTNVLDFLLACRKNLTVNHFLLNLIVEFFNKLIFKSSGDVGVSLGLKTGNENN